MFFKLLIMIEKKIVYLPSKHNEHAKGSSLSVHFLQVKSHLRHLFTSESATYPVGQLS